MKTVAGVFAEVRAEDENGIPVNASALLDGEQDGVFVDRLPTGYQPPMFPS